MGIIRVPNPFISTNLEGSAMKVDFVSREQALKMVKEGYFVDNKADLVSLSDSHRECRLMRNAWKQQKSDANAAIFQMFYDVEDNSSLFGANKALQLKRFVELSHQKNKDVVVHCLMGVSRSGAVAKFVDTYLGLNDPYLEDYTLFNNHVYFTLLEAAQITHV